MLAGRVGGKATYNLKGLESMVDYLIKGSSVEISVLGFGIKKTNEVAMEGRRLDDITNFRLVMQCMGLMISQF